MLSRLIITISFVTFFTLLLCLSGKDLAYATMFNQSDISSLKKVDVMVPRQLKSQQLLNLSGSIEARQHAQISALESGTISTLYVEIGDNVTKGQVLLELDSSLVRLNVAAAKAALQAAKVNVAEAERVYKEVQVLSKNQVVAQTLISERAALFGRAQAELAQVQANLAVQEALLSRHSLRAPFNGVISMRNAELGEWLSVQESAFELVNPNELRLNLAIAQEYYKDLAQAQTTQVRIQPDSGGQEIIANISRLVPVSDSRTRSFVAQIDLPSNNRLIAGMSARAEVVIASSEKAEVLLPRSAVKKHPDGGSSVFIVENGRAKRMLSDYRNMPNDMVAIALTEQSLYNNKFVISGVELLKDGDKISVVEVSNGLNHD